jgi:hypothetical protein
MKKFAAVGYLYLDDAALFFREILMMQLMSCEQKV